MSSREDAERALACPLDEAWAEVEAALPEGYAIMLRGSSDWMGSGPTWKASAYHSDGRRKVRFVEADTPAAALHALAAALTAPNSDRSEMP